MRSAEPEVVLDSHGDVPTAEKQMAALAPDWVVKGNKEQAAMDALSGAARDKALLTRRQSPEELAKEGWKGAAIPPTWR